MMDSVLAPIIGNNKPGYGVACYIDDVPIYTNGTEEEHIALVNKVLEALERANLVVNRDKSKIIHEEVTFLGHVVGHRKLAMEEAKLEAVRMWEVPRPEGVKKDIQRFLGFTNYY